MGTVKDAYEILKDLILEAKKLKSQEMIALSMDVQEKLFDLKEEMENLKEENKELNKQLEQIKNPPIDEKDIRYYPAGFFTLNSEKNRLPYCSACWKTKRIQVPLLRQFKSWDCKCPSCQSKIIVLDENDREIG